MRTVYKYPLTAIRNEIMLPPESKFRHFGMDYNRCRCVWIEIETDWEANEKRVFEIYGTGHPISYGFYRGTLVDDPFVWHLYEDLAGIA